DEPLGALDKRLRENTQFELMNIQEKLGVTFVVVTHDQEEAMTLSTRIAMMDAGRFVQIGTPTEIYEFPESRLVANFIGSANMYEGRVTETGPDHVIVQSKEPECEFYVDHGFSVQEGNRVWVAVRPEKIRISKSAPESQGSNQMKGVIDDIGYLGQQSIYRIRLADGTIIKITSPNLSRPKEGVRALDWEDEIYLDWDPSSVVVLTK
ncbi:MAG: TOBE domain-containing protein, partial [Gammaproteobacteria bacterium]|nr:TOBE domain-containing protein [Gammaproteobacteria bacterium]